MDIHNKIGLIFIFLLGYLPPLLNGFYNPYTVNYPILYWFIEIVTWVLIPIALVFLGIKNRYFNWEGIGLSAMVRGKERIGLLILLSVVFSIVFIILYEQFISLSKDIFPVNHFAVHFSYKDVIPQSGILWFMTTLFFALTAGVVEEFYYRGILSRFFKSGLLHVVSFILISSFLFSLIHWEGGLRSIFSTFAIGIIFAIAYRSTGNLIPVIVGHSVLDFYWFGIR